MQSGSAILIREVYVRAVVQQHLRAACVVVQRGRVQGRTAGTGAVIWREIVGIAQQQPQIFVTPVLSRHQQLLHRLHPDESILLSGPAAVCSLLLCVRTDLPISLAYLLGR